VFDTLTDEEARELNDKLFSAGRKFADVSHTLAGISLANRDQLGFSWDDPIWQQRNRYDEAMREMHELRAG
jgi:hypothetical protein